jgi:hypothetical protein
VFCVLQVPSLRQEGREQAVRRLSQEKENEHRDLGQWIDLKDEALQEQSDHFRERLSNVGYCEGMVLFVGYDS